VDVLVYMFEANVYVKQLQDSQQLYHVCQNPIIGLVLVVIIMLETIWAEISAEAVLYTAGKRTPAVIL